MTEVLAGLCAAVVVLLTARGRPDVRGSRRKERARVDVRGRLCALRARLPGRASGAPGGVTRSDVADLASRLAALLRAGVPPQRTWQVLGTTSGPAADVARTVAAMTAVGGSVSEGLHLAARGVASAGGQGTADAVGWLAVAAEVVDRSGAPSAAVYDGITAGLLAELAAADEQDVALAAPRTTATVLSCLPLAGIALGAAVGADVIGTLLGSSVGRLCLIGGLGLWWAGRRWITRLVTSAGAAG